MGQRTTRSKKLIVQKETLRKLQVRPMTDQELQVVVGGVSATCSDCCHAPSQRGC